MNDFSTNLKTQRLKHNYTQEYLAYKLDVSVSTISRWERSNDIPYTHTLLELAYLFHIPFSELLGIPEDRLSLKELMEDQQHLLQELSKSIRTYNIQTAKNMEQPAQLTDLQRQLSKTQPGETL